MTEQQQEMEEQFRQHTQLMSITSQALDATVPTATPCVFITIGGKRTVALLDSGSTSTFINQAFAIKSNCTLLSAPWQEVQVAGGGKLSSDSFVPDCSFTIGSHTFAHTFRALNLPGHDVVLGCDWMKQYSPVSFHFQKQEFHLTSPSGSLLILPTCPPADDTQPIEAEQLCKLLDKGASGYVIQLCNLELSAADNTQLNEDIALLLQQFGDVFAEPTELPPSRPCDHRIPLVSDARPPQARPYRVPHQQKDELERQIKQLLASKMI
jgi:hypothetical protein